MVWVERYGPFKFEPMFPRSKSGIVHVGTEPNMVEAETEWVWAQDLFGTCKAGEPVFPAYRKQIFKHWVDYRWYQVAMSDDLEALKSIMGDYHRIVRLSDLKVMYQTFKW